MVAEASKLLKGVDAVALHVAKAAVSSDAILSEATNIGKSPKKRAVFTRAHQFSHLSVLATTFVSFFFKRLFFISYCGYSALQWNVNIKKKKLR